MSSSTGAERPIAGLPTVLLGAVVALFGFAAGTSPWVFVPVAVAGAVLPAVLRVRGGAWGRELAPAPGIAALAGLALLATPSPLAALAGGAAALALLTWIAAEPGRPVGRVAPILLLCALTLAIAWMSAQLLPSAGTTVGAAGALLAIAVVVIAVVLAWPGVLRPPDPATD